MLLEVCANSFESAVCAQEAGAHRIELCSALGIGGITPSYGMLKQVMETLNIPVHVLIRPRGGHFTYSEEELSVMKSDIKFCKEIGCAGIVSGVLDRNQSIDVEKTAELMTASEGMSFTFHRAFDWVLSPEIELQKLLSLKVDRVLTSGQEKSAVAGIDLLNRLKKIASNQLIIMPGGGITASNVSVFKEQGFEEVHSSATKIIASGIGRGISMNTTVMIDDGKEIISDKQKIKGLLERIK
ncbi:copper homeostasis protein CutC [Aquimarina sp. TRL1]|uniref:copper homeostasis protein CutC n=1 Tax=Aquimarina sp. (strain TRL1) TaxID=2736252 RepID=UPI001589C033|nr:copper homeostasis protein CutC [Aquimarina sp. TRL1]QKX06393.1 copper homeostasis protein CutC [Aquimarina sp. TRL1]